MRDGPRQGLTRINYTFIVTSLLGKTQVSFLYVVMFIENQYHVERKGGGMVRGGIGGWYLCDINLCEFGYNLGSNSLNELLV